MPYIRTSSRRYIDVCIKEVISSLKDQAASRDGCLNYTISSIINELYGRSYVELNAAIGVLECCKLELYRRVVAPYEDTKITENGDVYS